MTRTHPHFLCLALLGIWGFLFTESQVVAQKIDARVQQVWANWQKRFERIQCIRYRVSGERIIPKGTLELDQFQKPSKTTSREVREPQKVMMLLDFANQRFRKEEDSQVYFEQANQLTPRVNITVFDGKALTTAYPREANSCAVYKRPENLPDIVISKGNMRGAAFGVADWPFFAGHGLVSGHVEHYILPGRLEVRPDDELWHVHGEGVHAESKCVVFRTHPFKGMGTTFEEIWVDSGRESAILRRVLYSDGKPSWDLDIVYQETARGWLPQQWTFVNFGPNEKIQYWQSMHVDEISLEPPVSHEDFQAEIKQGMLVREAEYGGFPDQVSADVPIKDKKDYVYGKDNQSFSLSSFLNYLWLLLLILGAATGTWWVLRRKRRSGTVPHPKFLASPPGAK